MELVVQKTWPACRVYWVSKAEAIVAHGYNVYSISENGKRVLLAALLVGLMETILARFRLSRQGLRLGLHNLWPLPGGGLVGVAKKKLLKLTPPSQMFEVAGRLRYGNKPGLKGVCVADNGDVYYGEYSLNPDRSRPSGLYRSQDGGLTYQMIYEFRVGEVRHIHFIQWDRFGRCLWLGTGDANKECRLLRSTDLGYTWEVVGSGSQRWRAVGLTFTPEAVFWGTDAGSDAGMEPNYIIRLDRDSLQTTEVLELQGPCHGTASLRDRTIVVSTGIEGGTNEKDKRAHLWASRDGKKWQELASWEKDVWPTLMQFGVIHFPHGLENSERLYFTTRGLRGGGETSFVAEIRE